MRQQQLSSLALLLCAALAPLACGGEEEPESPAVEPEDPARPEKICKLYQAATAAAVYGGWTPGASDCAPGTLSQEAQQSALNFTNLYRYIAGQPTVALSQTFSEKAQVCAVLMMNNNAISHTPPASWRCYSAVGAEAAKSSNLAMGQDATRAVHGYMEDRGNDDTMGHRRWILGNWIGPTGFGTAGRFSCMWVQGDKKGERAWAAWPPPGPVPVDLVYDSPGWTFQSDSLRPEDVELRVDNRPVPVKVSALKPGYGSAYAVRFAPDGWRTRAGTVYAVTVSGTASGSPRSVTYKVGAISCP